MERTILVVEDSPTQAERLRLLLEGEGYRVEVAGNGREGLERVQAAAPDLIVSDVVMPVMDGYSFCRAVKSIERLRRIPFVLLTERSAPADIIKGFERGADNFITKPFEDAYLLERVRRIFEHLDLRRRGQLDVEIMLNVGGRQIVLNADKQQMVELLFATLEELVRLNGRLADAQRAIEEYAHDLEGKVRERTERLLLTEKIATMGELLAGVAHELNNPLSVILGHAALLPQTSGAAAIAARAEKIRQAAERCSRIVRNFLALARHRPPERKAVDLNAVAREAVELLAYPLRVDTIEVVLDLDADLPPLRGDPDQIHQVVVNLVSNAHQAMRAAARPRRVTLATRYDPAANRVRLSVADTGPGVPAEIRHRIFEPFFTTKPAGQGTGLGLSLCHGIVENHGGSLTLESPPGGGAVFHVDLPVERGAESAQELPAGDASTSSGRLRILVVDDEAEVARVLAEMLSAEGHHVDTAADGLAALERLRERAYDLVMSDLRMPNLDGPGLYREVERAFPRLAGRFVFLTGDTLSPGTSEFLARTGAPSFDKPFVLDEVRRAVQRALAHPPA